MSFKAVQKLAQQHGYEFFRAVRGSHQLWRHKTTGQVVLLSTVKYGRNSHNFKAELRRKAAG